MWGLTGVTPATQTRTGAQIWSMGRQPWIARLLKDAELPRPWILRAHIGWVFRLFTFSCHFLTSWGERLFFGRRDWMRRKHWRGRRGKHLSTEYQPRKDDLWTHPPSPHRPSWLASVRPSFATRTGWKQGHQLPTKVPIFKFPWNSMFSPFFRTVDRSNRSSRSSFFTEIPFRHSLHDSLY